GVLNVSLPMGFSLGVAGASALLAWRLAALTGSGRNTVHAEAPQLLAAGGDVIALLGAFAAVAAAVSLSRAKLRKSCKTGLFAAIPFKRNPSHAPACAIDLFVEDFCPAWQVGDDEAYVAALLARLDAGDDLAGLAPAGCGIAGLEEAPHLFRF